MARNYAQIWTAIWRDEEFCALTPTAQRTYLMLFSQPDISAVGILSLNLTRWARKAKGTTVQSLRADLMELHKSRFVAVDEGTEELLVRTFVKWDKGYGNPKRQPVIRDALGEVESPALRSILVAELTKLAFPFEPGPKKPPSMPATPESEPEEAFSQANSLSGSHSTPYPDDGDRQSPEDRVVVTQGLYLEATHNPQSTTQVQANGHATLTLVEPPTETAGQRLNRLTKIYTDKVKTSQFLGVQGIVRKALADDYAEARIVGALEDFATHKDKTLTATTFRLVLEGLPAAEIGKHAKTAGRKLRGRTTRDTTDWDSEESRQFA